MMTAMGVVLAGALGLVTILTVCDLIRSFRGG